jgi:hypothetical protein
MMAPSRGMAYASRASGTEQERYRAAECISRLAVVARERSGHEKGRPRRPSFARPHRHRQSGPLSADNHRLGGAVTARAGRSVDVQGGSAGAIGAGHDLVGAARSLRRVTDDPEARAGCLRARLAWRTSRPGKTLRALSPGGPWSPLSPLSPLAQPERATSTAIAAPATKMRIVLPRD